MTSVLGEYMAPVAGDPTHLVVLLSRSADAVSLARYLLAMNVVLLVSWSTAHAAAVLDSLDVDLLLLDDDERVRGSWADGAAGAVPTVFLRRRDALLGGPDGIEAAEPFEIAFAVQQRLQIMDHGHARWGPIELDARRHEATWHGHPLSLTPAQFRILAVLVHARGAVVTRTHLCHRALDGVGPGNYERLDAHLRRIRRLLEPDPSHPEFLLTVRGAGVRLADLAPARQVPSGTHWRPATSVPARGEPSRSVGTTARGGRAPR